MNVAGRESATRFRECAKVVQAKGFTRVDVLPARSSPLPQLQSPHQHHVPTLVACLRGAVRVSYAGGEINLVGGEAVVVAPGAWHRHEHLRGECVGYGHGQRPQYADAELYDAQSLHIVRLPIEPSHALLNQMLVASDPWVRQECADTLLSQVLNGEALPQVLEPAQARMEAYIWHNLHRPNLTAVDILTYSGLSHRQAHRLFIEHYGETPKQILLRYRLALAKQLMREGLTMTKAAHASGFANRTNLIRAALGQDIIL